MRRTKKGSEDDSDLGRLVVNSEIAETERRGTLRKAVQLRMECRKLVAERDAVWAEIMKCDQAWVDRFAMRLLRANKSVHENIQRHLDALDGRRRSLVVRIRKLAQQISDLGLMVDIRPDQVPPKTGGVSSYQHDAGLGRNSSGAAQYRDFLIRRYGQLSNEQLCRRLDFELVLVRDHDAIGLPETWSKKFGVKTYSDAYDNPKCKNLVQKLIAEAKREL